MEEQGRLHGQRNVEALGKRSPELSPRPRSGEDQALTPKLLAMGPRPPANPAPMALNFHSAPAR
jgi:hypothetical protein